MISSQKFLAKDLMNLFVFSFLISTLLVLCNTLWFTCHRIAHWWWSAYLLLWSALSLTATQSVILLQGLDRKCVMYSSHATAVQSNTKSPKVVAFPTSLNCLFLSFKWWQSIIPLFLDDWGRWGWSLVQLLLDFSICVFSVFYFWVVFFDLLSFALHLKRFALMGQELIDTRTIVNCN